MALRGVAAFVAAASLVLLAGCAAKPPPGDEAALADYNERNDPLEPTNRDFFAVNNALDRGVLRPAAVGYKSGVPAVVRTHLHNTLTNLGNPVQLANDMLQGKPRKAGNTLMRLILNSTIGIGGVFDVATGWGFPDHDTDFGLTLAVWQVPDGPFLFLPVLGPTSPRDAVGFGMGTVLDPLTWVSFGGSATLGWSRAGLGAVDTRSRLLDQTDAIDHTALDPYATYRSLYQQHRQDQVSQATQDLPATVPGWYPSSTPAASAAGPSDSGAAKSLAPSPSETP